MYRKIGLLVLVLLLGITTVAFSQENSANKDSILKIKADKDFKLINIPEVASKKTDIKIMVKSEKEKLFPILYYKNAGEQNFKHVEMQPQIENSPFFVSFIPASENISDYIEIYISDKNNKNKTNTYIIQTPDMSISPLAGLDDSVTDGDFSINSDSTLTRYYNDVSANGGVFNGYDLDNFSDSIISPTGTSTWPSVNSKNNQMRTTGSNPHKGLDFNILGGQSVVSMLDGYFHYKRTDAGINNYYAARYDLQKQDHKNSADLVFYYIHIDPSLSAPTTTVTKGTTLGKVRSDANHLHVSIRDFNNFELPHYYFFKNISSLDYGYRTELIQPTDVVGKTVSFKGYVYDENGPEDFVKVNITYETESSGTKTAQMTKSGNIYSFTFPSQYNGEPVAFYVTAYRYNMPYDMKSFKPSYYNIYLSGSTHVSTPPIWSVTYGTYVQ